MGFPVQLCSYCFPVVTHGDTFFDNVCSLGDLITNPSTLRSPQREHGALEDARADRRCICLDLLALFLIFDEAFDVFFAVDADADFALGNGAIFSGVAFL